jgi:tRNA 2-thiouridine synthesizing protein A
LSWYGLFKGDTDQGQELTMTDTIDHELDYRGLSCPLPVLKAQKAFVGFSAGAVVLVLATDPAAPRDFAQFCEHHGHFLLEQQDVGEHFEILLKKK